MKEKPPKSSPEPGATSAAETSEAGDVGESLLLKRIGLRIQHDLHLREHSADWLASAAGVARSTVREMIAGRANFRYMTLDAIVRALGYADIVDFTRRRLSDEGGDPARGGERLRALNVKPERVVLIEDEPTIREGIRTFLEEEGYEVLTAAGARAGLHLLRDETQPGLVLLDLMMPEGDGWEFLKARRQDRYLARVPVVVLSALAERAKAEGATDMLPKPLDLGQLLTVVQTYCSLPSPVPATEAGLPGE